MDYFWRDNKVGIDYRGFYRIFSKYQVKLKDEKNAKNTDKNVFVRPEIIVLKKNLFDKINHVLLKTNTTV